MAAAIATEPEPRASRNTAVSCLTWLRDRGKEGGRAGASAEVPADAIAADAADEEMSIARLVALVRAFGFDGEIARLDWSGLYRRGFAAPTLVVLNNGNVAVLAGGGRGEVEEVAVWDPLDRDSDGAVLYVAREMFERAWSGYAVRVTAPAYRRGRSARGGRRMALRDLPSVRLGLAALAAAVLIVAASPALRDGPAPLETIRVSFVSAQPLPMEPKPAPPTRIPAAVAPSPPAQTAGPKMVESRPAPNVAAAALLLARGDGFLRQGDVASARAFYERAVAVGSWQGAARLGETFDPAFLARARLNGVTGDLQTALAWYRRARSLGASEQGILHSLMATP